MPLRELTAKRDRCDDWLTCPGVFERQEGNKLVIVGLKSPPWELNGRIGEGEVALEIDRDLVTRALAGPLARFLIRAGL